MSYVFYGANSPKSIAHLNVKEFLDILSDMTNGFQEIPNDLELSLGQREELSGFTEDARREANYFCWILPSIIPYREEIIKVFANQNIYYEHGELNFDKIHKIFKAKLGQEHKIYIAYKGLIVEKILGGLEKSKHQALTTTATGLSLERAVLETYRSMGYVASETKASGDFGIDIIAESNISKIGIQCKNHTSSVGVEAVMQAHSGGHYYGCTRFVVYSVNGFTSAACEMASKLNVELLNYKGAV